MGIRHLDTFIRTKVPNGCFEVNIEHEIRKYYNGESADSDLPPPIIVIDLMTLYPELSRIDMKASLCGGRFNVGYRYVDYVFSQLKALGVTLEFFLDGPTQKTKVNTWCKRRDTNYKKYIEIINAVDKGTDMKTILTTFGSPCPKYALEHVAKRYGRLTVSIAKECDQEMAAYASKIGAMAIISDDTDFLIYEGKWRFWSCKELDFDTFTTMEYNRVGLVEHLSLDFKHMPLFATLCGNDIVPLEEVKHFHQKLGDFNQKFYNVADFVRQQSIEQLDTEGLQSILRRELGDISEDADFKMRFQQSMDFYDINYTPPNMNPTEDPVLAILLTEASSFAIQTWLGEPTEKELGMVDLRRNDIGKQIPHLLIHIMQRMAGIILHHHPEHFTRFTCYTKLNHESGYGLHEFPVEPLPRHLEPPTLIDLHSKDPAIEANLQETKLKLLCWIASGSDNSLDPQKLEPIPIHLWATILSIYFLLQTRVLKLFEADLLLQVAYDVSFHTYNPLKVQIPTKVESRPFRLVSFYKLVYTLFIQAIGVVGLSKESDRPDPPFDGVLFHTRYGGWSWRGGSLEQIAQWRIYANLADKQCK